MNHSSNGAMPAFGSVVVSAFGDDATASTAIRWLRLRLGLRSDLTGVKAAHDEARLIIEQPRALIVPHFRRCR